MQIDYGKHKLYEWQHEVLTKKDNNNEIWCCETGTGKTFAANLWLDQKGRSRSALIICPKQIRKEWKETRPDATVFSFEDFLRFDPPSDPSAIVVDEADAMASPLFVAKLRSKRSEKLFNYVMQNPKAHMLLLTATPVRSTPWNMHTLLTLSRRYVPWDKYREQYFSLERRPYLPRPAWLPKPGWRKAMQGLIDKYTHVALMSEMVDEMPEERHEIVRLKDPNYEEGIEWEPMKKFVEDHRLEQEKKHKKILEIAHGYRKVIVVAHYRAQIDELEKKLSKDRPVYVLDGRTKEAKEVIEAAEEDPECFFIIQASVGAGFEVPSFACMIFASMSYGVRNYTQMIARIKRINALKPVIYYYILGGRADRIVHKNVMAGKDFVPSFYRKNE